MARLLTNEEDEHKETSDSDGEQGQAGSSDDDADRSESDAEPQAQAEMAEIRLLDKRYTDLKRLQNRGGHIITSKEHENLIEDMAAVRKARIEKAKQTQTQHRRKLATKAEELRKLKDNVKTLTADVKSIQQQLQAVVSERSDCWKRIRD